MSMGHQPIQYIQTHISTPFDNIHIHTNDSVIIGENLYNIRRGDVMKISYGKLQHESLQRYSVFHGRPLFNCDLSVTSKTVSLSWSVNRLIFSSMSSFLCGHL